MISCLITSHKQFMGNLLTSDCFDAFLLQQASIVTSNTFQIDGRIEKEFFSTEEWENKNLHPYEFSCWADMRTICFSLIRGKRSPVSMKIVLSLKPEAAPKYLDCSFEQLERELIKALVVTIRYDNGKMTCTTGISFSSFSTDKDFAKKWDKVFLQLLDQQGITYQLS